MISTAVLRKIRRDRSRILAVMAELRAKCVAAAAGDLAPVVELLDRELREHLGLVEAVLEAVTEDDLEA